jgi:hypothetical protein
MGWRPFLRGVDMRIFERWVGAQNPKTKPKIKLKTFLTYILKPTSNQIHNIKPKK